MGAASSSQAERRILWLACTPKSTRTSVLAREKTDENNKKIGSGQLLFFSPIHQRPIRHGARKEEDEQSLNPSLPWLRAMLGSPGAPPASRGVSTTCQRYLCQPQYLRAPARVLVPVPTLAARNTNTCYGVASASPWLQNSALPSTAPSPPFRLGVAPVCICYQCSVTAKRHHQHYSLQTSMGPSCGLCISTKPPRSRAGSRTTVSLKMVVVATFSLVI